MITHNDVTNFIFRIPISNQFFYTWFFQASLVDMVYGTNCSINHLLKWIKCFCKLFLLIQISLVLYETLLWEPYPTNIYLFQVNNGNTRKRCEICSKLTIKTTEQRQWMYFRGARRTLSNICEFIGQSIQEWIK